MEQSNISAKNIQRLETLTYSELPVIADLASLVLAVARVKPHKRRRFKFLATRHRDLLNELIRSGLICNGYLDEAIADMDEDEAEAFLHRLPTVESSPKSPEQPDNGGVATAAWASAEPAIAVETELSSSGDRQTGPDRVRVASWT